MTSEKPADRRPDPDPDPDSVQTRARVIVDELSLESGVGVDQGKVGAG